MTNDHMILQNAQTRRSQIMKALVLSLMFAMVLVSFTMPGMAGLLAGGPGGGGAGGAGALNSVLNIVIGIVKNASLFIGVIIAIWGVFQIVLAFRREDSEGISKQITTIVVGTVLTGFGAILDDIVGALM